MKISEIIQGSEKMKFETEDADMENIKKIKRCGDVSVCSSESREIHIVHKNVSFKLKF